MSDNNGTPYIVPTEPPPHAIAFIVDGVVEEVIRTSDRFAALLLSNPTVVYATGTHLTVSHTTFDATTNTFTNPNGTVEQPEEFEIKKKF